MMVILIGLIMTNPLQASALHSFSSDFYGVQDIKGEVYVFQNGRETPIERFALPDAFNNFQPVGYASNELILTNKTATELFMLRSNGDTRSVPIPRTKTLFKVIAARDHYVLCKELVTSESGSYFVKVDLKGAPISEFGQGLSFIESFRDGDMPSPFYDAQGMAGIYYKKSGTLFIETPIAAKRMVDRKAVASVSETNTPEWAFSLDTHLYLLKLLPDKALVYRMEQDTWVARQSIEGQFVQGILLPESVVLRQANLTLKIVDLALAQ